MTISSDMRQPGESDSDYLARTVAPTPRQPTPTADEGRALDYFATVIDDPHMLTETKAEQLFAAMRQYAAEEVARAIALQQEKDHG